MTDWVVPVYSDWVEADFRYEHRNRVAVFDVEFLFPKTLEHAIRVIAKLAMLFGIEAAVKGESCAENFFWRIDDESAFLRDAPGVDCDPPSFSAPSRLSRRAIAGAVPVKILTSAATTSVNNSTWPST